jgi:REP element-mobilizing transposase RayT
MPQYKLFYQLVWTTKNRIPVLEAEIETGIFLAIRKKASGLRLRIYALNGFRDHVHLVVSIPPRLSIANVVGEMKGYSSFHINHHGMGGGSFYWQEEYGAFSLDESSLSACIGYVENQKPHHSQNIGVIRKWELPNEFADSPAEPGFSWKPGDLSLGERTRAKNECSTPSSNARDGR